jgi:glucokinase
MLAMGTRSDASADGGFTAGVDLGGTKIQTVVVDGSRDPGAGDGGAGSAEPPIAGQAREPTPRGGADDVTAAIVDSVRGAMHEAGIGDGALRAVGIGSPGRAADGVVSHSPNVPGMQDAYPLGKAVSDGLGGVPVTIGNDVAVATLGELHRGAGRPFRSLGGVFVGTGVGGGLVFDREIWHGRGGAGEIGHTTVKPDGRRCGCGGHGHLEAYAGRASMEAKARRLVEAGHHTNLFELMDKHGKDRMTSGIIARALEHGDEMATRLMDRAVWALGLAISSTQNLLDVDAFIIGGGLTERFGQPFVDRIAEHMRPLLFVPERPPAVLAAGLGDLSGAVGGVVLAGG